MRVYVASPYPYDGNQAFFDNNAGLLYRGFQSLGIESKAITLGPPNHDDVPDMGRATWEQMESPDWWRSLEMDALVFLTWGNGKYYHLVKAAVSAGIRVIQVTDTQGITSPVADWRAHLQAERAHYWSEPRWRQMMRTLVKLPFTFTTRVAYRDLRDARTIAAGDYFLAPTPRATERYQTITRRLLGKAAARKVRFMPFPVNFHFKYSPDIPKQDEVVAVGRWDSLQKRTPFLTTGISETLKHRPSVKFRIFGQSTPELENWHLQLPEKLKNQVSIEGAVPNSVVAAAYQSARVILVSSAYEGCHNASAEAICCGTSVVGFRTPFLGVLEWHTGRKSGRLADQETPVSLARALLDELGAWDRGERDPAAISKSWVEELHADKVASRILDLLAETSPLSQP